MEIKEGDMIRVNNRGDEKFMIVEIQSKEVMTLPEKYKNNPYAIMHHAECFLKERIVEVIRE